MRGKFRIIDSDIHVQEPTIGGDFLNEYLDKPYRSRVKVYNASPPGDVNWTVIEIDGRIYRKGRGGGAGGIQKLKQRKPPPYAFKDLTADDHLHGMDVEGIDVGVVFPSYGLSIVGECIEDVSPDLGNALARSYNNWMHDFCSANPARLKPTAIVNYCDPVNAADEARRAVEELGAVALYASCNAPALRPYHEPFYDPLWAELERLGVPVCFHPAGSHKEIIPRLSGRTGTDTMEHAIKSPFLNAMNVSSLTVGGVFERFPKLRAGFLESSATWIVWLLWRLDDEVEWFGPGEGIDLRMKPSEYFRRQGWVACEPDEETLKYVVDYLGDDCIVISSDFPHPNSYYPEAMNRFAALTGVSDESKRKILWDNPIRLYDLNPETAQSRHDLARKATDGGQAFNATTL